VRLPKELQLAKLVAEAPEGDDWLHEVKFDGYRIVAIKDGADVKLVSRRFKDWTATDELSMSARSARRSIRRFGWVVLSFQPTWLMSLRQLERFLTFIRL